MLKTEADLMKGIDDKFQKLLSQFEMNMNILGKSKRQQFLIGQTQEKDDSDSKEEEKKEITKDTTQKKEVANSGENSGENSDDKTLQVVSNGISFKGIRETGSEKSESMDTVKEIDTKIAPKPKMYSMKLELKEPTEHVETVSEDDTAEYSDSMGSVLKYISECAEMKNKKNKKYKKIISFSDKKAAPTIQLENSENTNASLLGHKKITKKKKPYATLSNDNLSGSSSKKKTEKNNHDLMRKCSKTITNISKKAKKRNLRNSNNNSKDWITFNRNNAGRKLKDQLKNNLQLVKKDFKQVKKAPTDKPKNNKEIDKQVNKIEHFDTVENKLINDFFKNDFIQDVDVKSKNKMNDIFKKTNEKIQFKKRNEDRISFRTKSPLKTVDEVTKSNELNVNKNQGFLMKKLNDNKRNIQANSRGKENKFIEASEKLETKRSFTNNKENDRLELKNNGKFDDKKIVLSNMELGKVVFDKFKNQRETSQQGRARSALDMPRAQSEMKVSSSAIDMLGKNEDLTDLEGMKVELDEFFSEIPFVAGKSISRTFNLGLSFQHAMSMLKRVHSKKDVKEVLSIGRPESVCFSESSHCMGFGSATCEAMFPSDWTKEDEEALEENPWDVDLNRRRPKCTCLPKNCTTLKNVLKQLAIKNPGFNMRSLKSSIFSPVKVESDIEGFKKPALKRAKSQTRTELLRNIRTIQIQLTPSTEILK